MTTGLGIHRKHDSVRNESKSEPLHKVIIVTRIAHHLWLESHW
jgi:hypothetical protein